MLNKIAICQIYIHLIKNVQVNILPPNYFKQIIILDNLYKTAVSFMKANNVNIINA